MTFTPDTIFKNLQAVQEARGKKVLYVLSYKPKLVN
jgi:hypothetical protein